MKSTNLWWWKPDYLHVVQAGTLIFVCSPFAGDQETNAQLAREYCKYVMECGGIPFAPHLHYPQLLDDNKPEERQKGLEMSKAVLPRCDELWAFDTVSEGMDGEITLAHALGKPVTHFARPTNLLQQLAEAITGLVTRCAEWIKS